MITRMAAERTVIKVTLIEIKIKHILAKVHAIPCIDPSNSNEVSCHTVVMSLLSGTIRIFPNNSFNNSWMTCARHGICSCFAQKLVESSACWSSRVNVTLFLALSIVIAKTLLDISCFANMLSNICTRLWPIWLPSKCLNPNNTFRYH